MLFKGQLTWQGDGVDAMCACACLVTQSCLTLCNPLDYSPPGASVPDKNTGVCYHFPPGDLPDPGIKPSSPVSPALQADSLPAETLGKPRCVCIGGNAIRNTKCACIF